MSKRALILINPVAGRGTAKSKVFDMVNVFASHGYTSTVLPTLPGDLLIGQVKDELAGHDLLVIVGGDGTLNRSVNAIMHSGAEIPVGYIPLGSTNDFGKSLGLSSNVLKACESICEKEPNPIDIGCFDGKYFVYIACTGVFTEASYATPQHLKNAFGHSAYLVKGISTLAESHSTVYRVETSDGKKYECECIFASVSNSLRAGGIVKLPKSAVSFDDGMFELIMVPTPKNAISGTMLVADVLNSDITSKSLIYLKSDRFRFEFDMPHAWSLDGENGGETLSSEISVVEKAIYLIR